MARRSSKPEEEKDAGKPVEPTEPRPSDPDSHGFPEPAQGIDNKKVSKRPKLLTSRSPP